MSRHHHHHIIRKKGSIICLGYPPKFLTAFFLFLSEKKKVSPLTLDKHLEERPRMHPTPPPIKKRIFLPPFFFGNTNTTFFFSLLSRSLPPQTIPKEGRKKGGERRTSFVVPSFLSSPSLSVDNSPADNEKKKERRR